MDLQQLKLLAGRVRDLLEQSNHSIGHNQSLDLIAALPGLRNWPEVQAFPDRVSMCELDMASASRLAFRLKKKFSLDLSPHAVLATIAPLGVGKPVGAPQIWPAGPKPGVYVTTSQEAINALLERYEEATDGALVYAERAGNHWEGSIDLGDSGLWSNGLTRVPSGTLIVVGPVELNQQAWSDSASHLQMACLNAVDAGHRVAVLIETPTPELMCEDVSLLVRSTEEQEGDDWHTALVGIVTKEGELQERTPFSGTRPQPAQIKSVAQVDAIPAAALPALRQAIAAHKSGLLLFGTWEIKEHSGIDQVAASLALTEHAGPAARIMPRSRSTPAKDWDVPEAIKQLPFLPSIESAYDQGYRRIIYNPHYTSAETLLKFSKDVLFISGRYGSDVESLFIGSTRGGSIQKEAELAAHIIAVLSVIHVPGKGGTVPVSDLFVKQRGISAARLKRFDDIVDYLTENRTLKWQDAMAELLESGKVRAASLKKEFARNHKVMDFLSQRDAMKKPSPVM